MSFYWVQASEIYAQVITKDWTERKKKESPPFNWLECLVIINNGVRAFQFTAHYFLGDRFVNPCVHVNCLQIDSWQYFTHPQHFFWTDDVLELMGNLLLYGLVNGRVWVGVWVIGVSGCYFLLELRLENVYDEGLVKGGTFFEEVLFPFKWMVCVSLRHFRLAISPGSKWPNWMFLCKNKRLIIFLTQFGIDDFQRGVRIDSNFNLGVSVGPELSWRSLQLLVVLVVEKWLFSSWSKFLACRNDAMWYSFCTMECRGLCLVEFGERRVALSEESMWGKWHGGSMFFKNWSVGLPDEFLFVWVDFVIGYGESIVSKLIFAIAT